MSLRLDALRFTSRPRPGEPVGWDAPASQGASRASCACPTSRWWPKIRASSGEAHHGRRVVRRWGARRRGSLRDGGLVPHGLTAGTPLRWVPIRDPQGIFATQALLCADLHAAPERILSWFVLRWKLEVTFLRGASASGSRDPAPMVGAGDPADDACAVGSVLAGHAVCPSANDANSGCRRSPGGLVPQRLPPRPSRARWRW